MPRHPVLLKKLVVFAVLAMCGPVSAADVAAPGALSGLASTLEAAPEAVRADFASIALSEMIATYEHVLETPDAPASGTREAMAKQARWSGAVQGFLDDLYVARDELDAGAPVDLLISPPGSVYLKVGHRLIAVGSPRLDEPQLLEQQIVRVYCDLFACAPELVEPPAPLPVNPAGSGVWSFAAGQRSTYETIGGLGFMFADLHGRSRKEKVCLQVGEELERLSRALARARERGRAVDMHALRVEATAHADEQLVVYSASGETVRVHLPALVDAPALVTAARAWIAARSEGKSYSQRFPRAESLLARLLPPP